MRSLQHHTVHGKGQANDNIADLRLAIQAKGSQTRCFQCSNISGSKAIAMN